MLIRKPRVRPTPLHWLFLLSPPVLIFVAMLGAGLKTQSIQFFALYLPGVWLLWQSLLRPHKIWLATAHLWAFVFSVDVLVRVSLWVSYSSLPDSSFILLAISNTTAQEVTEFFTQNSYFALSIPLVLAINGWIHLFHKKVKPAELEYSLGSAIFVGLLILLLLSAYALRPTRSLMPLVFWPHYFSVIDKFQTSLKSGPKVNRQWDDSAKKRFITYSGPEQQTLVLALGESTNRMNMQLCNYGRATTPKLTAIHEQLAVFCKGYSGASSTVPSLKLLLTEESLAKPDSWDKGASLLSVARAAGFKIFWLSNQDDRFTTTMFGNYADKSDFVNRRSGRTSVSLDENLLADYKLALVDDSPRKLIVVHLIGSHPNYAARYPADLQVFSADTADSINQELEKNGRNLWIRSLRAHYDNSVLYQDHVLALLIEQLKAYQTGERHFVFASDHGNEVGHVRNFAGHSPATEAGYAVPLIYWGQAVSQLRAVTDRTFVTDNLDQSLLHLVGIQTNNYDNSRDVFSASYQWQPPKHWPLWKH
jgi:heptose-I-phosphate ethanolaminephosphotransferase